MKNIREMTDEQLVELAALGLADIWNFDFVLTFMKTGQKDIAEYFIKKELWETKPELMVIRVYLHGSGNTHFTLWETDDNHKIDITVVQDDNEADVANIIPIVKKLMEWGYVI